MKQIESRGKASAHAVRKCHTDSLAAVKVTRETCKWHANQRRPGGGFRVDVVMAIMPDDMHDMHAGVQMLRLIDERWDRKGLKSTSLRETIPNAVERGEKFNRGNRIIWKGKHWHWSKSFGTPACYTNGTCFAPPHCMFSGALIMKISLFTW